LLVWAFALHRILDTHGRSPSIWLDQIYLLGFKFIDSESSDGFNVRRLQLITLCHIAQGSISDLFSALYCSPSYNRALYIRSHGSELTFQRIFPAEASTLFESLPNYSYISFSICTGTFVPISPIAAIRFSIFPHTQSQPGYRNGLFIYSLVGGLFLEKGRSIPLIEKTTAPGKLAVSNS
jgi:hypothetical protein